MPSGEVEQDVEAAAVDVWPVASAPDASDMQSGVARVRERLLVSGVVIDAAPRPWPGTRRMRAGRGRGRPTLPAPAFRPGARAGGGAGGACAGRRLSEGVAGAGGAVGVERARREPGALWSRMGRHRPRPCSTHFSPRAPGQRRTGRSAPPMLRAAGSAHRHQRWARPRARPPPSPRCWPVSRGPAQLRIALAAPTGKAAARACSRPCASARRRCRPSSPPACLPRPSPCIACSASPRSLADFRHHAGDPLAVDVLVVDEASMLDLALATRLVHALPPTRAWCCSATRTSSAAVEAGAVFAELSAECVFSAPMRARLGLSPGGGSASTGVLADSVIWLTESHQPRRLRHPAGWRPTSARGAGRGRAGLAGGGGGCVGALDRGR